MKLLIVKDEPCWVKHVSFALTAGTITHFRFCYLPLCITQHNPDDVIRVIWASISLSKAGEHWGHGVWKTRTLTRQEGSHKVELHGQKDAVFLESDLYLGIKSKYLGLCCSHVGFLKKCKKLKATNFMELQHQIGVLFTPIHYELLECLTWLVNRLEWLGFSSIV